MTYTYLYIFLLTTTTTGFHPTTKDGRLSRPTFVNNLAVCSDGRFFKTPKTKIKQFRYLRSKLQAKGTKSARRKLKALSGRQRRYMTWFNHNVSKQIVNDSNIALEDLTGIRGSRNKYMGKRLNRWINNWSFRQLQSFIQYKAEKRGLIVRYVNPYMTSQTCSRCGEIGSRYSDSFVCVHCGYSANADLNASFNLRRLFVTQPIIPKPNFRDNQLKSEKPTNLLVG